jgi:hypothetical protein
MQVGQMPDLVHEHRTTIANSVRPAMRAGVEHEVVENASPPTFEQIEQGRLPFGPSKT